MAAFEGGTLSTRNLHKREICGTSQHAFRQNIIGDRLESSQSLMKKDLLGHFGCVNAIEFSSDGKFIASGGDDRRLLLWNICNSLFNNKEPDVIDTLHISNINSCCFDCLDQKIATGGNDGQVIIHDFNVHQSTAVYGLSDAVYCLSADPQNPTILATASDEGKAQIIDTRLPTDTVPYVLADLDSAMHSVMYNPVDPRLLVTANSKHGIALWDIRKPLKAVNYKSSTQNCMSVRFNRYGDKMLALRRRAGPVLYDVGKSNPIYEFDYNTYYNACTLKSCSFAGLHDEYVMSGSDDFCIYLWKMPDNISENYVQSQPHMILKGHRSIVNQVRYCPHNQVIISSGVEKLIKLWSPYSLPGCTGRLLHSRRYGDDEEVERDAYSHEEYIHMVLQAGSFLSHDYSNGNVEEEPCMIAFFDSLIQREIEQNVDDTDGLSESDNENNRAEEDRRETASVESNGRSRNDSFEGSASVHGTEDEDMQENGDDGARGGGRLGGMRSLPRSGSDAPLCSCDSPQPSMTSAEASFEGQSPTTSSNTATSSTTDNAGASTSNARRSGSNTQPRVPYFGPSSDSSSDSDSDVDEILSFMYRRYMNSRERVANSATRPGSKKISNVIARGKQRDNHPIVGSGDNQGSGKRKRGGSGGTSNRGGRLQRIREDLQHSGDQFLRDNANTMSVLADVIDNFVDNMVADDPGNINHELSDTNDGNMSSDSMWSASGDFGSSVPPSAATAASSFVSYTDFSASGTRTSPVSAGTWTSPVSVGARTLPVASGTRTPPASLSSPYLRPKPRSSPLSRGTSTVTLLGRPSSNGSESQAISAHTNSSSSCSRGASSVTSSSGIKSVSQTSSTPFPSKLPTDGFSVTSKTNPQKYTHSVSVNKDSDSSSVKISCSHIADDSESKGLNRKFVMPKAKHQLLKKPQGLTSHILSTSSSSSSLSSEVSLLSDSEPAATSSASSAKESDSSKENQSYSSKEESSTNTHLQFKKSKIKGRQFRVKALDVNSSSDEEEK